MCKSTFISGCAASWLKLCWTQILDLCGIKYLEYNGSKSDVERNRAIKDFETQDDIFVMLLSNVGTTGLNMAMASVVIFLVRALLSQSEDTWGVP